MVVTQRRLTAEEYLALPPERNTQLIDGEIVVNDPSLRRQRILLEAYQRSLAAEVWLVGTEPATVLVYRGDEALEVGRGQQLTTPLLPGLAIDMADLFDR